MFKKQKYAINVIIRDIDIQSTLRLAGVFYIEVYGNNACFLTSYNRLYLHAIYLNGTSMKKKKLCSRLNHDHSAYQCTNVTMKDNNRALCEESLVYPSLYHDCYKMAECPHWAAVTLY